MQNNLIYNEEVDKIKRFSKVTKYKTMRGPLRFPGGKSRAVPTLLNLLPKFKEYREPMIGGGSVFLSVRRYYSKKSFWINDINSDLYSFWLSCKYLPDQLTRRVKEIKESSKDGRELFHQFRRPEIELNDLEIAVKFYVLNRISFSGLVDTGGYSEESFQKRFTDTSINRIKEVSYFLQNVKVTNLSYEKLLREPGDKVFLYIDPPYYGNKKSKLYGKKGVLHTSFDHEKLLGELKRTNHKWLLTYDNAVQIKEWYSFAQIHEGTLAYGMNNTGKLKKAERGKELFISNYKLAQSTLDKFKLKEI
jgi:DNA adenine methylase